MASTVGAEKLDFKTIINYTFVSQFDLLRDSQQDIRSKLWSIASNRFLMDKLFERDRAREEITRLNVEIAQLRTWIRDEDQDFQAVILAVRESNRYLAAEIENRAQRRFWIHECLLGTLRMLERVPGFTGTRIPGQNIERAAAQAVGDPSHARACTEVNDSLSPRQHESNEDSDVDAGEDRLDRVIDALDNMM